MFNIGEFASIGRVSVRMLRHYDEIGLLPPARVDPHSGYRSYEGKQFAVLGRILAFKDPGFRLDEVARIMQGTITTELKPLPAQHVALTSTIAPGFGPENISPVIGPLFGQLAEDLATAGIDPGAQSLAMYEAIESGDGEEVRAYAAFPVNAATLAGAGFTIANIPGVALAATTVHHGSMATIGESWEALHAWIEENGYELAGVCRELYIVSEPEAQENWMTELQQPVIRP
ncbi:MerR family transcriptional regulator [Arthrobacter sp. Sr24]